MPVHPDLAVFLELAELGRLSGATRALHELPVDQAREVFEQASDILDPTPPGDLQVTAHEVLLDDGQVLAARLYRPRGAQRALPVIFYLHGGGYVVGSLDSHDSICRRLAAGGRFAVFAPAYRRAPEHPFPGPLDDVRGAANWLAGQAQALQLDAGRVIFAGDSVGASLATVLAIIAAREPERLQLQPKGQLLLYPVTDISRERASHQQFAEGYLLETETLRWFYQQYLGTAGRADDWRVSPLLQADLSGLAPAYLAVAEYDPLFDEGLAYAQALREQGNALTLQVAEGLTHDFLRMSGMVEEVGAIYAGLLDWASARVA
ncbi:alpha/beta hydrolase [Pseudomonas sichuanensis]|uniref:alpha/beta hydrolase n=1 Tax=Pseudomonas sichuanensis TaxID=2213015 RepID=UPI002160225C|nr:alpha/beta hydrolase [Pseudomonas sichuanensis]UVK85180.1 alpha/beta hydrolase [Pseudomonas sichuanensis]